METHFIPTTQRLDQVAWTIDQRGINAIPAAALRELGFLARSAGGSQILSDVLVDTTAPAVVRQRAFGHIASLLAEPVETPKVACATCAA
jgi:hypothetical protein